MNRVELEQIYKVTKEMKALLKTIDPDDPQLHSSCRKLRHHLDQLQLNTERKLSE